MKSLWEKYAKSNPYANDIKFLDTIAVYERIGGMLEAKESVLGVIKKYQDKEKVKLKEKEEASKEVER